MRTNWDRRRTRCLSSASALALAALTGGCLQIETRIKLNEDGSAVVTERLEVLRPLLQMETGVKDATGMTFEKLLSRERAQERAGQMGQGVTLVSHKASGGRAGSRVSETVYRVADLTHLVYASPFVMRGNRIGAMQVRIQPQYSNNWSQRAGILFLKFEQRDLGKKDDKGELLPRLTRAKESPLVRQQYRDIAPAFRDMLRGFKLRVIFENYGPILGTGGHASHQGFARPKAVNIINYSYGGETGGNTGRHPLDEEEVVVDLMKMLWARPKDPWSWRESAFLGPRIGRNYFNAVIRPSRHYFKKYFEGKELNLGGKPPVKRMARFEEIGEGVSKKKSDPKMMPDSGKSPASSKK